MNKPYHIPLRNRERKIRAYAIVDEEDWLRFGDKCWALLSSGYAHRQEPGRGVVLLHREILGLTKGDGLEVDHENGNKLDCRKGNLRLATRKQNMENLSGPYKNTTSGIRGVSWDKKSRKWRAHVTINYKTEHLGNFDDIEDATKMVEEFRATHLPFSADARKAE